MTSSRIRNLLDSLYVPEHLMRKRCTVQVPESIHSQSRIVRSGTTSARPSRNPTASDDTEGEPVIEDRRVRRTRAALRDALLHLMTAKGYDAVTVQDLIDRADVGRSTFYAHYGDKADLLHELLAEMRATIEHDPANGGPDRRRPLRFSLRMFRHVQDQQDLLRALLGRPGGGVVVAEIEQLLTDLVRAELDALAHVCDHPRLPLDLVARAVVAAYLATLVWWVGDDFHHTPQEMDAYFHTLLAPGVRAALPPRPAVAGDRAL
jgi:AcrR family transcriptional regulator